MTKKKKSNTPESSDVVSEEIAQLVLEVQSLSKVRAALSFGTKTGVRDSAESTISRKINAKVTQLSQLILKEYKEL